MPANYTNQSMLRRVQGGSPTNRLENERSQSYTRNSSPNTVYNSASPGGQRDMYSNMYSNYGWMNPLSMAPAGGQYGSQQMNLGRYQPPTMGGGQQGPYAYNLPNAFGGTGLNYMGGFGDWMSGIFNPFMGSGGYGQQQNPDQAREALSRQGGGGGDMWSRMMGTGGQQVPPGAFQGLQNQMGFNKPMQQGPSRSFMSGGVQPGGEQFPRRQLISPGMMDYSRNNAVGPGMSVGSAPYNPSSPLNWWGG